MITAPAKLREARRGGRTDDRESRLLPDREKAERADFTYVNTGTPEELDAWVGDVMATLLATLSGGDPSEERTKRHGTARNLRHSGGSPARFSCGS